MTTWQAQQFKSDLKYIGVKKEMAPKETPRDYISQFIKAEEMLGMETQPLHC